jgi:hypothetical protein
MGCGTVASHYRTWIGWSSRSRKGLRTSLSQCPWVKDMKSLPEYASLGRTFLTLVVWMFHMRKVGTDLSRTHICDGLQCLACHGHSSVEQLHVLS